MADKFCKNCKWFRTMAEEHLISEFYGIFTPSQNWCVNPNNTSKNMVNGADIYKHPTSFLRDGFDEGKCGLDGRWFDEIPSLQNQQNT